MSSPASSTWRRWARAIPGTRVAHEALFGSPGSWLYCRPNVSWLGEPELRSQLPWLYRLFGRYCASGGGHRAGAESVLRVMIWCREHIGREGFARLRVGGLEIVLDLHDPRFLAVPLELGGLPDLLSTFLAPGDTFLDIGANHGAYSVVASAIVGGGGRVIAIEPQPRLAAALSRSLSATGTPFAVHAVACGDRTGETLLHVPRSTSGSAGVHSAFSAAGVHRRVSVVLRRLDDLVAAESLPPGRLFVKLDVEGSERSVLAGARRILAAKRPALLIEINAEALRAAGHSAERLIRDLVDLGYDRYATPADPHTLHGFDAFAGERDVVALPAGWGSTAAVPEGQQHEEGLGD